MALFFPCHPSASAKFRHPFTAMICGATGSGKTNYLIRMIRQRARIIEPTPSRVIYSYKRYQAVFDGLIAEGVELVAGTGYTLDPGVPTLLVIDDQMHDGLELGRLFSVDSHHGNCSVLLVTHNLFHQSKEFRTASLNAHYFLLFKSPRGLSQVTHLARQLYGGLGGGKARKMVSAYADATARPYGYLLVDLHPLTPEGLSLRADLLRGEGEQFMGSTLAKCYAL